MSRTQIPTAANLLEQRLRQLLGKARSVKSTTSIEPALSSKDFDTDIAKISKDDGDENYSSKRPAGVIPQSAFETATRNVLYEKVGSCDVQDPDFVDVWNLLDIVQLCADYQHCDSGLTLWLVEEMLDSQTIDGCRSILEYLKSRRVKLVGTNPPINKRNTILRTCNELLRRLSRAENAVFCGDVFMFLFQIFPLGDKSAVNLRGVFHVENTTTFDELNQEQESQDADTQTESMQVDQGPVALDQSANTQSEPAQVSQDGRGSSKAPIVVSDGDKTNQKTSDASHKSKKKLEEPVPTSRQLYSDFWSLQHIFSNPQRAFDGEALNGFKKGLELTVRKFQATPKIPRVTTQSRKRKRGEEDNEFANTFNPKYLTSSDLFDLELSDLTFQRHILVQALILIDFLLSMTPKNQKKLENIKIQKSMTYNYTLSEEDEKWCSEMKGTISRYLQGGADGKFYYRMVDNVLSRDKNWVVWKMESCQDIKRDPVPFSDYSGAQESAKRTSRPKPMKSQPMGALDLSFLDESSVNASMERLRNQEKTQRPSAEALVREVQNADLDLEMVDKETNELEWAEQVGKRASKTWRALRLASGSKLSLFPKVNEAKGLDELIEPDQTAGSAVNGEDATVAAGDAQLGDQPMEANLDIQQEGVNGTQDVAVNG